MLSLKYCILNLIVFYCIVVNILVYTNIYIHIYNIENKGMDIDKDI